MQKFFWALLVAFIPYWCTEKFYNLSKEERDAVVEFINSI